MFSASGSDQGTDHNSFVVSTSEHPLKPFKSFRRVVFGPTTILNLLKNPFTVSLCCYLADFLNDSKQTSFRFCRSSCRILPGCKSPSSVSNRFFAMSGGTGPPELFEYTSYKIFLHLILMAALNLFLQFFRSKMINPYTSKYLLIAGGSVGGDFYSFILQVFLDLLTKPRTSKT